MLPNSIAKFRASTCRQKFFQILGSQNVTKKIVSTVILAYIHDYRLAVKGLKDIYAILANVPGIFNLIK